ncbi:MAG: 4Fe-4S binding protein [Lachnospiraceae bacterium]|nr:4Fe-4S binding protein [Lachnospiraceae bacterium]
MGLDVNKMVSDGTIAKCTECIQCGTCVDECPKKVLSYKWIWR